MLVKLVGIFANVWRWQILLRGQGIDLELRLPHQHVLHRPLLRHRHAEHDGARRVAALRDDPAHAPAGRVHDGARGRAADRARRPLRRDPPLHAVRRPHHAGPVVRRDGRRDEGAVRRRACSSACCSSSSRAGSAACLRLVPTRAPAQLRRQRDRRRDRVLDASRPSAARARAWRSSARSRRRSCTSATRCRSRRRTCTRARCCSRRP